MTLQDTRILAILLLRSSVFKTTKYYRCLFNVACYILYRVCVHTDARIYVRMCRVPCNSYFIVCKRVEHCMVCVYACFFISQPYYKNHRMVEDFFFFLMQYVLATYER